jgi:hypothetical protein
VCYGKPVIPAREVGIEIDGALEKWFGVLILSRLLFDKVPKTAMVGLPGIQAVGWLADGALTFRCGQCWPNRDGYAFGDLVLHRKNVGEIAVVTLRP